jgi:hypothetical protein
MARAGCADGGGRAAPAGYARWQEVAGKKKEWKKEKKYF